MTCNVLEDHPSLAPGVIQLISDKLTAANAEILDLKRRLQAQQSPAIPSPSGEKSPEVKALQAEVKRLNELYARERHRGRILEDNQRIAEERAEALRMESEAQKTELGTLWRVQKSLAAADTKIRNLKRVNEALRRKLGSSNKPHLDDKPEDDAESMTLVASTSERSEILDLTGDANKALRHTLGTQQAASSTALLESQTPQGSGSISTASRPRYLRPEVVITRLKPRTSNGSSAVAAAQKRPHETGPMHEDSHKKRRLAMPPTEHSRQLRQLAKDINENTFNQDWYPFLKKLQEALDQSHPGLIHVCPKPICWADDKTRRCFETREVPQLDLAGMPIVGPWFSGPSGDAHQFKLAIMTTFMTTPKQNLYSVRTDQLKPDLFNMWTILVAKGPEGTPNSQRPVILYTADLEPQWKTDRYVEPILKRGGSLRAPVWKNLLPNETPQNKYRFPHTLDWLVGLVERGLESRWEAQQMVFLEGFSRVSE